MHLTRIAALLLGVWLGGCLFMDTVATQNFRSVDRMLTAPTAQMKERIQVLGGHDAARALLRYQASEQNRQYFATWESTQIALGLLLILMLVVAGQRDRVTLWLAALMLCVALVMHFLLTPEIIRLGRAMDFAPAGRPSGESTRFWIFHGVYSALELIKLGWGVALGVWLVLPRKKPQQMTADPLPATASRD
jgi:preprotein translocase subunit SecG